MKIEREIKDRFTLMARSEKKTASEFLESLLEQRMREHMLDQVRDAYARQSPGDHAEMAAEIEEWNVVDAQWPDS